MDYSNYDLAKNPQKTRFSFSNIIGENIHFRNSIHLAKIAAKSDIKILLQGESGTGKEMFAQSIHNMSARAKKEFVAINCGAIPKELVESELFGYEGGAFTGAKQAGQKGKFELAQGSTLFLDEIGALPYEMQAKLLRVLEENQLRRVGGNKLIGIDIRLISATNKDLLKAINEKEFRDDLYYRLGVIVIEIPPLRKRKDDLPHLVNYFIFKHSKRLNKKIKNVDKEVSAIISKYNWPGNIRELENVIERAILLCENNVITTKCLPEQMSDSSLNQLTSNKIHNKSVNSSEYNLPIMSLKELEYITIKQTMDVCSGNVSKAANLLGIGRNTLYRKLQAINNLANND